MPKSILAALFFAATLSAQLTPNSVTVTATRAPGAQADQVIFSLSVSADLDATLDDVVAAVRATGATQANFNGIGYYGQSGDPSGDIRIQWGFALPVPITKMKTTAGLLTAVQQNLAKDGKFALSFSIGGIQSSDQAQQAQNCPIADLISDARAQAQKLAAGAGMSVGAIQAMSGVAASAASGTNSAWFTPPLGVLACSLTVKFALGGF